MPTITVPDAVYQRLAARAAAAGTTVEAVTLPILEHAVEVPTAETPPVVSANDLPYKDWKQNMDALDAVIHTIMAGRLPPDFVLDDSRESIYEGCGE